MDGCRVLCVVRGCKDYAINLTEFCKNCDSQDLYRYGDQDDIELGDEFVEAE